MRRWLAIGVVVLGACGGGAAVQDSATSRYLDPLVGGPASGTVPTTPTNASIQLYAMVLNLAEQGALRVQVVGQADWTVDQAAVGAPQLLTEGAAVSLQVRDGTGALLDERTMDLPELGELLVVVVPADGGGARLVPFLHDSQPRSETAHRFRVAHAGGDPVQLSLDGAVPVGGDPFAAGDTVDADVDPALALELAAEQLPADGVPEVEGSAAAGDSGGSWVFLVDRAPVDGAVDGVWRWRTNGTPEQLP